MGRGKGAQKKLLCVMVFHPILENENITCEEKIIQTEEGASDIL